MADIIFLLSGGKISTTLAAYLDSLKIYRLHAVTISFGLTNEVEVAHAVKIAEYYKLEHYIVPFMSALNPDLSDEETSIIFTNLLISIALNLDIRSIALSSFNRHEIEVVSRLIKPYRDLLGHSFTFLTPFIGLTQEAIYNLGSRLNAPYEFTYSCQKGGDAPCGLCRKCYMWSRISKKIR